MLTVSLLARISSYAHHSSPPILMAALLVVFVAVAVARLMLSSRGFRTRVGRSGAARFMFRPRGLGTRIGGRGGEGVNPFGPSGGTVDQIDRTL